MTQKTLSPHLAHSSPRKSGKFWSRWLKGSASPQNQLDRVMEHVRTSRGAVIFLESIGWDIHLLQRPHHLAREFARQGYVAIFDSSDSTEEIEGFKEMEPNLFVYRGDEQRLCEIPNPILWTFPYNFERKDRFPKSAVTVYDWIDDLELFARRCEHVASNHARAMQEASVVASVSRRLHAQAIAIRPDALYLPNAVEYEHFSKDALPLPDDPELAPLLDAGKPIAGYYGALAEWFDYDVLNAIARLRPDWNFLLIGPMLDGSLPNQRVLNRSNVTWIGARDYKILPAYLRLFDVATIPFRINEITLATSPLKLFEYFAGGKPVVTSPMPECQAIREVLIFRDLLTFSQALDLAHEKAKDENFQEKLRAVARANCWSARVQKVVARLQGTQDVTSAEEILISAARLEENSASSHEGLGGKKTEPFRPFLSSHPYHAHVGAIAAMTGLLMKKEQAIRDLRVRLSAKDEVIKEKNAKIKAREKELDQIHNSLAWRLFDQYGRIKYRYLLPLYRWLKRTQTEGKAVEATLPEESVQKKSEDQRAVMGQHTREVKYEPLSRAMEGVNGKVAVVIVSYNNPQYLKQCLESIWEKTEHPRFEVVVVDNGSGAEVEEYLREAARKEKRLQVIFNGENLGFARANNIGIQAARECEYVVLLNDDTVVTRGWLGKLVRYLEDDEIGLIGPVTSWAGNEARIEVDYEGISEMDSFAETYMRKHEGRSFDIAMLAMYCIGMRRSLLEQIGMLDEQFGIGMFEDDDFSLRVRSVGYRIVCAEDIFIHHWGLTSFRRLDQESYQQLFEKNRRKFEAKWGIRWRQHEFVKY